jgi:hypothetical protein
VGKPEGKKPIGRPRCSWKIILNRFLGRIRRRGLGACGSGQGQVTGSYEHGDGTSGSIK